MWSNPKVDAALQCVSTNDQMIQSNVVPPIKNNAIFSNWRGQGWVQTTNLNDAITELTSRSLTINYIILET